MTIEITGLQVDPTLRTRIASAMEEVLERVHPKPLAAHVAFTDENGPKNAPGIRCALTVNVPRRPVFRAEQVDTNPRAAFDAAFEALARALRDEAQRVRDLRRRPKKYFMAKRLLSTEPSP